MSKHHQHGAYYVPDYSWWPILAAIGLFLLGLGSIEYFGASARGPLFLLVGTIILVLVTAAWFISVIRENHAGLYDAQMHRSFLWGMGWFIFSDAMLFATLLGVLWYYRIFNLPELGGDYPRMLTHFLLWPEFVNSWPVLVNPDPAQFNGPQQGLSFNIDAIIPTLVMLGSVVTLYLANQGLLRKRRALLNTGLIATFFLIIGFILLSITSLHMAVTRFGITLSSGIYGSLVVFGMVVYLLHVVVSALMLLLITLRSLAGHFSLQDNFSIRAFTWFWFFIAVVWIAMFFSIY